LLPSNPDVSFSFNFAARTGRDKGQQEIAGAGLEVRGNGLGAELHDLQIRESIRSRHYTNQLANLHNAKHARDTIPYLVFTITYSTPTVDGAERQYCKSQHERNRDDRIPA
jgi:hypothetical protein